MTLADGAGGYAGPLGLLVVLLLGVATVFLIRSMNARIKRLPDTFEKPEPEDKDDVEE
jgi:F0F1-type ATP synthase assembly protein I